MNKNLPRIPLTKLQSSRTIQLAGPATLNIEKEVFSDGILLLSPDSIIQYANSSASVLLGYKNQDLVGKTIAIPGLENNTYPLHKISILDSQRVIEFKTSDITLNKERFLLVILQDVTRQYEHLERLNLAIEATQLGLWDHNFKTNSTSVNSYYATMLGYTVKEFDSSSWINLVHPLDLDMIWDAWNKHISGLIPFYFAEYRIRTKSGGWKWLRARAMVKDRDENGNPLHYIGTHQDITKQKQAERDLQLLYDITAISIEISNLEQKLEKILKKILGALNADKGLIHLCQKENNSIELSAHQGFSQKEIHNLEEIPIDEQIWQQSIRASEKFVSIMESAETQKRLSNISNTALMSVYPITIRQQTLGALSIFWTKQQPFTDLDDHVAHVAAKQLAESIERENLRQTAELAAVNKERQRLARELHDSLSQSLYSVSLSADGGEDFARMGDIEKISSVFRQIKDTIQQASREMRLMVYELRPSILAQEGLNQALKMRLDTVEKHAGMQATLENKLTSVIPSHIEVEFYGIAQEALNNVLKHSGAKSVKISLSHMDGNILMEIRDDGQGFNFSEELSFGGFGLSSMKGRADRIGGKVSIISNPGEGTCVSVLVPFIESSRNEDLS